MFSDSDRSVQVMGARELPLASWLPWHGTKPGESGFLGINNLAA
jgi:hypothetical protein